MFDNIKISIPITANFKIIKTQLAAYIKEVESKGINLKASIGKINNELTSQEKILSDSINKTNQGLIKQGNVVDDVGKKTSSASKNTKAFKDEMNDLNKTAEKSAQSFTSVIGKVALWTAVTTLVFAPIKAFKDMIASVVELDNSLLELNKVTNLTEQQLKDFTDTAYEVGKTIARTGKEVLDGTAEFSRAGYNIQDALELSKTALIMTNVAEGINTVEEASSSLIAVLKGYQMEANEATKALDIMNEVSNTQAINFDSLADGLRRTSGTLGQTGTELEELSGLLVGGFEPLRNIEMVSSGLIMISQRLRGIGKDGEAVEGLASRMQDEFKRVAGIDIVDPETNGLRSTYDILADMARIFPTLNDQQRQYLGELAAGNRQAKVLNAILLNWKSVEKATESARNSMGSALEENKKYQESIQGKINDFTSSVQRLWKNTIDSETIKNAVDLGTKIVDLINKVGILTTVIIGLNIALATTSKMSLVNEKIALFGSNAIKTATQIKVMTTQMRFADLGFKAFSTTLNGLKLALRTLWPLLVFEGAFLIYNHFKSLKEETEAINNSFDAFNSTLEDFNQTLDSSKITQLTSDMEALEEASNLVNTQRRIAEIKEEIASMTRLGISTEEQAQRLGILQDELTGLENKIKPVIEAQELYNQALIDADEPFKVYNDRLLLNKTLLEEMASTNDKAFKTTVENAKNELEILAKNAKEKLKLYGVEIVALKSIEEARKTSMSLDYSDVGISARVSQNYLKDLVSTYDYLDNLLNPYTYTPTVGGTTTGDPTTPTSSTFNLYEDTIAAIDQQIKQLNDKLESDPSLAVQLQVKLDLKKQVIEAEQKEIQAELDKTMATLRTFEGGATIASKIVSGEDVSNIETTNEELADAIKKVLDLRSANRSLESSLYDVNKEFEAMSTTLDKIYDQKFKAIIDDISSSIKKIREEEKNRISDIEDEIDAIEKSYNRRIEKKKEELKLLEREYELEDRMLKLRELDEELAKVQNDTRFEYIDSQGNLIYTFNKERYNELVKEREDLIREYERDDIKNAIKDEIDRLEEAKRNKIQILKDEIANIQRSNEEKIKEMEEFQTKVKEMQDLELQELKTNIDAKIAELQRYQKAWAEYKNAIAGIKNGISGGGGSSFGGDESSGGSSNYGGLTSDNWSSYRDNFTPEERDYYDDIFGVHHKGLDSGFAGNIPFDPKTEVIAKLLKGEVTLTKPQFNNIIPNVVKGLSNVAQTAQKTIEYNFHNVTVKANDINDFIKSMNYKVQAQG